MKQPKPQITLTLTLSATVEVLALAYVLVSYLESYLDEGEMEDLEAIEAAGVNASSEFWAEVERIESALEGKG